MNEESREIATLKSQINELEVKLLKEIEQVRFQLMRVKNGERLSDRYLSGGLKYQDLSPHQAWDFYSDPDKDFTLLDVSDKEFHSMEKLPEVKRIPMTELMVRVSELGAKTHAFLVISEDGTKSILACEILAELGFHNLNNVSGGYRYWPNKKKAKLEDVSQPSAHLASNLE